MLFEEQTDPQTVGIRITDIQTLEYCTSYCFLFRYSDGWYLLLLLQVSSTWFVHYSNGGMNVKPLQFSKYSPFIEFYEQLACGVFQY